MPAKPLCDHAESAISPLEETDIAAVHVDSRIEIPTAPTKNPKLEMMTSTPDDAELLEDLRGPGKPSLFDGNDTDVSFFPVSEDDSILLRHMDDVVDTSPGEPSEKWTTRGTSTSRYRRFSTLTKLLISLLRYSDKFRREPPRPRHPSTMEQWPASISGMTDQEETPTRTSKAKPLPNSAGQKRRIR